MKKIYYLIIILSAGLITGCSKAKKNPVGTVATKTGTTLNLIQDSIFLYAQEDYLWNSSLPSYATFNPRSYTAADDLTALSKELDALSQYAINPATNLPYEYYANSPGQAKYSFIDDGTETAALNGVKGDFGFNVQYNKEDDLRVEYVYPGSPAGLAGITRGCRITAINGRTALSYDGVINGTAYGTGTSANLNFVVNAIYNSGTIAMTVTTLSGSSVSVNINAGNYTVNPVLKDTVLTAANGHKVGYIVFNSFTSDANADPVLDAAFSNFAAKGINDLVVDLRYNGGGYVSTAEHLDNLIVPSAKSGTLMYNTYYNSNLVNHNDPLLNNQSRKNPKGGPDYKYSDFSYTVADNAVSFSKSGSLNVGRVFFIITGATASASELTINNLRPEMDVQFIGETSYGKPVGFFDIDINKYIMYTPEFSVKNSANQGDYYSGFIPGGSGYPGVNDFDDLTKDFGDPTEGLLAHALTYVNTGKYAVQKQGGPGLNQGAKSFSLAASREKSILMNSHKLNGMVLNKKLKLIK